MEGCLSLSRALHCPVGQPQPIPHLYALSAKGPSTFLFAQLTEHALGYWDFHLASFGSGLSHLFPWELLQVPADLVFPVTTPGASFRMNTQRQDLCLDTMGGAGCY